MGLSLRVRDVFRVGGRTVIATDQDEGEIRVGDRFRAGNGTEFTVRAVSFTTPEAWAAGRRGLQVEVTTGEVAAGQVFERSE